MTSNSTPIPLLFPLFPTPLATLPGSRHERRPDSVRLQKETPR